ncbi:hypothetical protein CEXT_188751, partial [Caerostris extrusa]
MRRSRWEGTQKGFTDSEQKEEGAPGQPEQRSASAQAWNMNSSSSPAEPKKPHH